MPNFDAERRIELDQIRNRLREIQQTIYSQRQPITGIECCVTGPGRGPERMPQSGWKPFTVYSRWGGFDQTTWFRMKVTVPVSMKGYRVVALVRPGGESLAYVDGNPFQGLDGNRDELYLTEKAKGGETFEIVLESVPSVRFDEYHYFQYADIAVMHPLIWDFWWDCTVVHEVLQTLELDTAPKRQLADLLNDVVKSVDLQHVETPAYSESIAKAHGRFRQGLKHFESAGLGQLVLMGQSHIDTAWLWPLRETQRKCARTFSTALKLMEHYPEFYFMASQPVQYEWMKTHYPEVYRRIKQRVKEGRWEPLGASWVESDCNVPWGESLIRQFLYGNRFFRKEFGVHSRIAWLPDTFGFAWSLPQILKKCQLDAFVTTKISWSQYTQLPHGLFHWEGADGTRILALLPYHNYNGNPIPRDCITQWERFPQKDKVQELPFPYGHGDGGGGPTMSQVEHVRRMANIYGVPKCRSGRMRDCIERIQSQVDIEKLPVWNSELYLERHRACQTTQARTKRNNRKSECLLRETELISSLSLLNGGRYDHKALAEAWKTTLTHQFHDILPGSSITEVYTQADKDYAKMQAAVEAVREAAIGTLARKINTAGEGTPVLVFNALSWVRDDVAKVTMRLPKGRFSVVAPDGTPMPHQRVGRDELLFEAHGFPPLGYAVYRVVPGGPPAEPSGVLKADVRGMENDLVRIRFDKQGGLASVYDKVCKREVLAKGRRGNVLQLFDDRPRGDDAWDIDFNFEESMWEPDPPVSVELLETGPVRAVVRFIRQTEKSTIVQDITLYAGSPRVDFVTQVDWWEKRVLLKAAFPVEVRSSRATYEIPFGAIERATHRNTAFDQARFEVPAQRWADLSEGDYGVSLLNDCKYGYDVRENVLRLSLLRAPIDPDPKADEGRHMFTYALYPHAGSWRNGTVQQAALLNQPLHAVVTGNWTGPLPAVGAFASVDAEHVIVDTVKRHEDSDALIVRLYEAYGQRGDAVLTFARKPKKIAECDMMEENDTPVTLKGHSVKFYVKPYEIRTFKVVF